MTEFFGSNLSSDFVQPNSTANSPSAQKNSTPMSPDLAAQVIETLKSEHGGAVKGRSVNDIKCLRCGEPKAWTSSTDPRKIRCNKSSCDGNSGIPWKEYAPSIYQDRKASLKKERPTQTNHEAYARQRGILHFTKWGGLYTSVSIGKGSYEALGFKTSSGQLNYRVINPPFENASHWNDEGSPAASSYWSPSIEIDTRKPIYIAESPLKAMALLEIGAQSISLLSARNSPENMPELLKLLSTFTDRIILAFDSDEAGKQCANKWYWFLVKKGLKPSVAYPTSKDWDEMLLNGELNIESLMLCEAIGGADFCGDIWNAFLRFENIMGYFPKIIEFKKAWYKPITEAVKTKEGTFTKLKDCIMIMNGILKPAYTLIQQSLDSERPSRMQCFFAHYTEQGRPVKRLVDFDPKEITQERDFAISISRQTGMTFIGEKMELATIKRDILKILDMPQVRATERYGYDYETGSFVFPYAAFTKEGKILRPNEQGFYTEIGVKPTTMESSIKNIAETGDVNQFYELLYAAGREQALLVAGFYVWTMCSSLNFDMPLYCKNHPFLSISGRPGSGKSTLVTTLNTVFSFQSAHEGVVQGASTVKGILRTMAKPVCVTIVLAENNKEVEAEGHRRYGQMDENAQLGLYNRQSGQTRANKEGSGTNRLPFDAGLIFSQNYEPFTKQSMKERVISVKIDSTEFTDEQKKALAYLQNLSLPQNGVIPLTGVGSEHYKRFKSLAKRQAEYIPQCAEHIRSQGVQNDRNIYHHGNLLAALCAMRDEFNLNQDMINSSASLLVQMAKLKPEQNMGESDTSTAFFEAFEALVHKTHESGAFLEHGREFICDDDKIYMRLTEVCNIMGRMGYDVAKSSILKSSLRQCGRYHGDRISIRYQWIGCHEVQKTWVFKRLGMSIQLKT
jgi:energy-coupling factor transporter ATP-binding protein EcfA2